jgi:hypothetical protein
MRCKRGQIFILAAVIIVVLLILVTMTYNSYREEIALENFEELSHNYEIEAPKIINDAIEQGADEAVALQDFTEEFQDYAHDTDPNFGILYVFKDSVGNVHILNSLTDKRVEITYTEAGAGRDTKIALGSNSDTSSGEVCVGGFCTVAETKVTNFGEGFSKANFDSQDIENMFLSIKIGDLEPQNIEGTLFFMQSEQGFETDITETVDDGTGGWGTTTPIAKVKLYNY